MATRALLPTGEATDRAALASRRGRGSTGHTTTGLRPPGCGRGKRGPMGAIAQAYADTVIVTNDNPRTEDPNHIVNDIMQGITEPARVQVILDRREAIRQALQQASENDAVIILGKGHEQYQILGKEKRPYAGDYAVAADIAAQVHGGKQL